MWVYSRFLFYFFSCSFSVCFGFCTSFWHVVFWKQLPWVAQLKAKCLHKLLHCRMQDTCYFQVLNYTCFARIFSPKIQHWWSLEVQIWWNGKKMFSSNAFKTCAIELCRSVCEGQWTQAVLSRCLDIRYSYCACVYYNIHILLHLPQNSFLVPLKPSSI